MPRHSSEIDKIPDVSAASAEKVPDFAELQKQKEELFREMEDENLELSEADKMYIVSLVGNYSVKDAFELSKRVGLNGNRGFFALTNDDVVYKNKNFFKAFGNFLKRNEDYVENNDATPDEMVLRDGIARINRNIIEKGNEYGPLHISNTKKSVEIISSDIPSKIDTYYSHFIRNRRVRSPELPPNELTKVELTAEDHLRSNEAMLEESYYTGPIRKALGIGTERELEKKLSELDKGVNWASWEPSMWIWRDNLITKEDLDIALLAFNRKFDDEDMKKVLERARYAPSALLFNERKRGAEKGLVEQIKHSLIKRGFREDEFEIKQNEKSEYEVVRKEGENESIERQESVENREGLKLIEDIPLEIKDIKLVDHGSERHTLKLNEVNIVDGEAYSIYNERSVYYGLTLKKGQIVCEGGNGEKGLRKVGDDVVAFEVGADYRRSRWSILNGKVIGSDYNAIEESGIEKIGKSYYWVGVDGTSENKLKENTKEANYAVISDNIVDRKFQNLKYPPKLQVIEDKICYIYEFKTSAQAICFGQETFGPYDDIKLCENSKDKLIFYARKGDKHFVYVDGVEKRINLQDYVSKGQEGLDTDQISASEIINSDKDGIFISFKNNQGNIVCDLLDSNLIYGDIFSNVQSIDGHISWLTLWKGKWFFYRSGVEGLIPIKIETAKNNVTAFSNNIFISDGKRIMFKKGDVLDFQEITFGGDVEIVNSGDKLFIIESLADKKRVWEYDEKGELKLNEREQRDLDLANAVAKEDKTTIANYFLKYYPKEELKGTSQKVKEGLKSMYEQSKSFVGAVNQTIHDMPELFMDTFRAKDDKDVIFTEDFMSRMFYYMFPEARANRERALFSLSTGSRQAGRSERDSTMNYDQGVEGLASVDESGYYEMIKANREVLKLREPLPSSTFITQGIFGNHTESGWTKVNVPLNQEIQDPARETTFEFVDEKASQTINLPRIAGSKIITERLKGITSKGKEVPVKILEENNQGEVRVDKGKEAKRLTYSQSFSEAPKTMAEVTQKDYDKFRRDFERNFGDVMTKPIGDLGDELDIFVRGLKDKSPREQVIAIQEFCYKYGYYNLDKEPRDTNSFEERLSIMGGRMDELKEKDPKLAHKLYAGICTDFATLTTALLRKAGFVSGISTGFVPEPGSTSIKTDRAHAVSYVLWPSSKAVNGKPDMIIVDGTPSSITPKIVEQEKKAQEIRKELGGEAENELAQLEHILKTMDVEAIKKLDNGVLEKTLNNILYGVKQSHVDVMERVLNVSRYAGFDILEMTRGNLEDQIEFRKFLEEEIYKEKSVQHENRERRGEELFNTMLEFTRRFEKDKNIRGKNEALDVLEKVFDIAGKYLDPIEDRSAAAVITYLRARKMR